MEISKIKNKSTGCISHSTIPSDHAMHSFSKAGPFILSTLSAADSERYDLLKWIKKTIATQENCLLSTIFWLLYSSHNV